MNADIITTFEQGIGNWFGIACLFFILLCFAMFLLHMRIREVKMLRRIIKELRK